MIKPILWAKIHAGQTELHAYIVDVDNHSHAVTFAVGVNGASLDVMAFAVDEWYLPAYSVVTLEYVAVGDVPNLHTLIYDMLKEQNTHIPAHLWRGIELAHN